MKHLFFFLFVGLFFVGCEDLSTQDITGDNRISVQIPNGSTGSIQIKNTYDYVVRKVTYNQPGTYFFEWDGKNDAGSDVAQGLYFAEVYLDGQLDFSKIILIE